MQKILRNKIRRRLVKRYMALKDRHWHVKGSKWLLEYTKENKCRQKLDSTVSLKKSLEEKPFSLHQDMLYIVDFEMVDNGNCLSQYYSFNEAVD